MAKQRALRSIQDLTPETLADALTNNGFSGCRNLIVDNEINGMKFLNLSEVQLKRYRSFAKPSELHRLWSFLERIREHPDEFIMKDSPPQYLNYKPSTMKKPTPPKKPAEISVTRNPSQRISLQPLSPVITIVDSLKNNLQEKFKNARGESEDSLDYESTDWSDDEPDKRDSSSTIVPEDLHVEKDEEKERKLSAEVFHTNKQKIEMLFSGVRSNTEQQGQPNLPPRPSSLTRIYINVEELKLEQELLNKKPKPPVPEEQKPKMPPKPSKLVRQESLRTKLPDRPSSHDTFESNRSKINATFARKSKESALPHPPKLPPSFKLEAKMYDLNKPPERPPKGGGNDEQIPYEPEVPPARPPVRPPKLSAAVADEEDDTYEPPPNVGFIPKSIERFLDHPPPIPKKFPSPIRKSDSDCDEDGYLITSDHLTKSKESLFSKQDVPLPPIPTSTSHHEDELRRNAHYQDVDRIPAGNVLNTKETGAFLLRPSKKHFCVLMIKGDAQIFNVPVVYEMQRYSLLADQKQGVTPSKFQSLNELIAHYQSHTLTIKDSQILLKS